MIKIVELFMWWVICLRFLDIYLFLDLDFIFDVIFVFFYVIVLKYYVGFENIFVREDINEFVYI